MKKTQLSFGRCHGCSLRTPSSACPVQTTVTDACATVLGQTKVMPRALSASCEERIDLFRMFLSLALQSETDLVHFCHRGQPDAHGRNFADTAPLFEPLRASQLKRSLRRLRFFPYPGTEAALHATQAALDLSVRTQDIRALIEEALSVVRKRGTTAVRVPR